MKRFKLLMTSAMLMVLLSAAMLTQGCSTGPGTQTAADLQAQIAIVCPIFQTTLSQVSVIAGAASASSPVYARIQTDLAKAQPVIAQACAANAQINATTIQSLAQTALPAISDLVGSLNLPASQVTQIQTSLVTAEVALNIAGVVESQIQAAQAAKSAPASASTAAAK
jgi:hypothetical protein